MSNIVIRKANIDELKIVQDLNYELFLFDQKYDDALKMDWPHKEGEEYFKEKILSEDSLCLVAELDGQVIGYLAAGLAEPYSYRLLKRAELDNMFIKEEFRNQGVGSMLIEEFINWATKIGVDRVFVSAYFFDDHSVSFYKKNKFLPLDVSLERRLK